MTLVNNHSHDDSSMQKQELIDRTATTKDHDVVEDAIDKLVNELSFLREWGSSNQSRIHLVQKTGEVVDYLVEHCEEDPTWLKPSLNHVPPEKWEEYGVSSY